MRSSMTLQAILFLLIVDFAVGCEECDQIVGLPKYGQLHGSIGHTAWTNRTIFQFLNVPYAESPSGSRRFKAPVPIRPWKGIRNAQKFGIQCPTLENIENIVQKERENVDIEDCLNMAIYSTSLNSSRPVMVYIHGGFFANQNITEYPPNYLLERDVVLAVIGFRLDVFGFLSTNSEEIPGNAGVMDCIQALNFIKENIAYFGGDPNQITVFGQSSGAALVSVLVISPAVPANLFQRAIIQSASIFSSWAHSNDLIGNARTIAIAAGLNPMRSIPSMNQAFKKMNVSDLLKAAAKSRKIIMLAQKLPNVGSSISIGGPSNILPDRVENLFKSKYFKKSIPLIIGITQTDGSYPTTMAYDFLATLNRLNDRNFLENDLVNTVSNFLNMHDVSGASTDLASLTFWPNNELASGNFSQCSAGLIDYLGLVAFKAPVLKFAQGIAQIGRADTYLYTFDYKGKFTRFGYGDDTSHYQFDSGVTHSDDLIYLFPYPTNVAELNENDTEIAQIMIDLWTSFAINGIPTLSHVDPIQWEPLRGSTGPYLHINSQPQIGHDFRQEFTVNSRKNYGEQRNEIN